MKTYTVKKVSGSPDWGSVPTLPIDHWNTDDRADVRAWAQIAYDDGQLWVHLAADETNLRTQESGPLARTWEDSCLEFFFCPLPGDSRYFNIEMTPNCSVYLGVGPGDRAQRLRLIPKDHTTVLSQRSVITDKGWELFYAVPFSFIRGLFPEFRAESGIALRANCYKCGDLTDHPHWLSWNPISCVPLSFHSPEDFGTIVFE